MARKAEGWKLRRDPRTGIYYVRFRHQGRRYEPTTGSRDPGEAGEAAATIYAEIVSGRRQRGLIAAKPGQLFETVGGAWVASRKGAVIQRTLDMLTQHIGTLHEHFQRMDRVTDAGVKDYIKRRLGEVVRTTLVKELSTLRQFSEWAVEEGYLSVAPKIATPSKRVLGTPNLKRHPKRAPVELTEKEFLAIADRLPLFAPRARVDGRKVKLWDYFVVLWETGLRPVTVQALEAPTHFHRGARELVITDPVDKVRFGRTLPLTAAARAALTSSAPERGLIFGRHDLRESWAKARDEAIAAGDLPPEKAGATPYDCRHGRATQLANSTTNLAGVAYLLGHKHVSTTARYVHPAKAAASMALGSIRGAGPKRRPATRAKTRHKRGAKGGN